MVQFSNGHKPRVLNTNVRVEAAVTGARFTDEYRNMFASWSSSWKEVFGTKHLGNDFLAGLTVAAVAMPLNVALALASGLPASVGLIAGAIGGGAAAILGGSPLQVTGPAAALNFMVLAINKEYGAQGVYACTMLIGIFSFLMGMLHLGKLARFVPEAILAGFTTGVGLKLLETQIPLIFEVDGHASDLLVNMYQPAWLHEVSWLSVVCGLGVALFTISLAKWKRAPAALMGIALVTALSLYLKWDIKRIGEVSAALPMPKFPELKSSAWISLFLTSLPMAVLGAVESLLSARVADRMSGAKKPHNANLELAGQGWANFFSGLFGGMPVTGVVVRSSVNIQSGGKTRLAALLHALLLLLAVLFLSKTIAIVPVAALSGLLCVVGFRLVEGGTLLHLMQTGDVGMLSFVVVAGATVTGHLEEGLVAGGLIHLVYYWLTRPAKRVREREAKRARLKERGVRAILHASSAQARKPAHFDGANEGTQWLRNLNDEATVPASAFVHPDASVIGKVVLGENVHVAADCSIRADEGTPFFIGANSNVQDGVVMHALNEKWVNVGGESWAIYVGRNVSMAHQALVHGPCYVGDNSFIGFKAVVHDSVVGRHCYVGIGATVVGVEVPDRKYVPHGAIIDDQAKANSLPDVSEAHLHFNEDVVDVNRGLAAAYHEQNRARPLITQGASPAQARAMAPAPARFNRF